jgi:hypothetical protein
MTELHISMLGVNVSTAAIRALSGIPALTVLQLHCKMLTVGALLQLAASTQLHKLDGSIPVAELDQWSFNHNFKLLSQVG